MARMYVCKNFMFYHSNPTDFTVYVLSSGQIGILL